VALDLGRVPPDPVLFRLTGLPVVQRELYAAATFAECRDLDWALAAPGSAVPGASGFGAVLDIRDFAFDPAFRGVAMIDFFLTRLGVDPAEVPPARRRNAWLAEALAGDADRAARRGGAAGYVLVCPSASMPLRDMPEAACAAVLATLRDLGMPALSQAALPPAGSLAELWDLVGGACLVISTDTAMVHLADARGVPCLAIFTTHRPEWRARDYPLCRALHRPPAGLPPALEFSRGPEDEAAARAAWLDAGGLRWLTDAVADAVADARGDHV
jgi:hypothetical protein